MVPMIVTVDFSLVFRLSFLVFWIHFREHGCPGHLVIACTVTAHVAYKVQQLILIHQHARRFTACCCIMASIIEIVQHMGNSRALRASCLWALRPSRIPPVLSYLSLYSSISMSSIISSSFMPCQWGTLFDGFTNYGHIDDGLLYQSAIILTWMLLPTAAAI